ncbi:MAG: hypothetical protein JKY53_04225 [Flavobacteriales bacterium]|nr:hypothetical protein [Flavobacteriales bacterium]
MDANAIIYIAPNCHECDKVLEFVKEKNIQVQIRNLETQKDRIEQQILIYPALCNNDKVIAYGTDILRYLT